MYAKTEKVLKKVANYDKIQALMERYIKEALEEAKIALSMDEIPIGAVIVRDGVIIGRGHNTTEHDHNPTSHAEMNAIKEASKFLGETLGFRRLTGCDMYVTMEPCSMCAGALVWARIENLYVATPDPKAGGCGSVLDITGEPRLNHHVNVVYLPDSELKTECQEIVREFFRKKRELQKEEKILKRLTEEELV